MKYLKLIFLFLLLSLTLVSNRRFSKKSHFSTMTKGIPPFLQLTAKVIVEGGVSEPVRVYNENGLRIYKAANGLVVQPTGEIKILNTSKEGSIQCHRVLVSDIKKLTDNKTEGGRSTKELWIPSKYLDINYPKNIELNGNGGDTVPGTYGLGACWNWALNGDYLGDDGPKYEYVYSPDGIMNIGFKSKKYTEFNGLKEGWRSYNLISGAKKEFLDDLEFIANFIPHGTINNEISKETLAFRRALTKVVVSAAGFTILPDDGDDRFQIHMITSGFFNFDHWALSMKMGDDNRNYIQKIPPKVDIPQAGPVQYNCNIIWEAEGVSKENYKKAFESINILSFKRKHLEVLAYPHNK